MRRSRLCSVILALAVLLGNASALHAATATWIPNPETDIAGYILSYGTQPGVYPTSVDVGAVTTWQLTTLTPGQRYYFVVQAYNTSAMTSSPSVEVVFDVPIAGSPTLTQPANQTSAENTIISLPLVGNDPDGDPLTYSVTGLPPFLSVNAATGLISGTLTFTSAGTYSVTAAVSDGSLTNSKTFTWTVTIVPSITSLSQSSGPVGMPLTISGTNFGATQGTSTVTFNGTAATSTSWSAASIVVPVPSAATSGTVLVTVGGVASNGINFTVSASAPSLTSLNPSLGAVGTPVTITGANFGTTQGTSTVTFSGIAATATSWSGTSISVPVPSVATTGTVVVTVGGLASNGISFTVNTPPVLTAVGSLSTTTGAAGALQLAANDADGETVTYSAVGLPPGLALDAQTGLISGTPSAAGVYPVTATAADGTLANSQSFTWTVGPPAFGRGKFIQASSSASAAPATTVTVRYAVAQTAGHLNVVVVGWRDATALVQSVTDTNGNGYLLAVGPTVSSAVGTQAVYYATGIRDATPGGNVAMVTFSAPPTLPDVRVAEYAGIDSGQPIDVTAAAQGAGTRSDSGGVATTFGNDLLVGANLVAGAATTAPGPGYTTRLLSNPAGNILEERVVTTVGSYGAAADGASSTAWIMQMVAFRVPDLAPTLTSPGNQISPENTSVSLPLLASDPDGDLVTFSATGLPASLSVDAATGLISGTLPFTSAGSYNVTATASDGSLTDSRTFTWTVTHVNRAPTLTQPSSQTSAKSATVSLQLVASDPDNDALTYSATGLPAPLTVNAGTGLISGTLLSTSTGQHTVTAMVSDGMLSSSQTFNWTVTNVTAAVNRVDFDGDGKTDVAVYSPSTGTWRILQSSTNYTTSVVVALGSSTDIPVPGDYDGDGRTDPAVYSPSSGLWQILQSSTNYATTITFTFGIIGDRPVPGDYDGDGKTDIAIYRPSTGLWQILQSSTNYATSVTFIWGISTDLPVLGDYDGDGKTDVAVYRPSTGAWSILKSSTNYTTSVTFTWGRSTDLPVPGDYDGDGKTDIAVYRPSTGAWYILKSSTNTIAYSLGVGINDIPVPGDYDGNGKTEMAVFRPSTGTWYILGSETGAGAQFVWGVSTDIPIR